MICLLSRSWTRFSLVIIWTVQGLNFKQFLSSCFEDFPQFVLTTQSFQFFIINLFRILKRQHNESQKFSFWSLFFVAIFIIHWSVRWSWIRWGWVWWCRVWWCRVRWSWVRWCWIRWWAVWRTADVSNIWWTSDQEIWSCNIEKKNRRKLDSRKTKSK